jgi:hypothetical protein
MKTKSASPRTRKSPGPAKLQSTRKPLVIDTSDIPPLTDKFFEHAIHNPYPPLDAATLRKLRRRFPQGRMTVKEKVF